VRAVEDAVVRVVCPETERDPADTRPLTDAEEILVVASTV